MNECNCGKKFDTKLAECPDNKEGCLVAHYDKRSFICPHCKKDLGPEFSKAITEGRIIFSEGTIDYKSEGFFKTNFRIKNNQMSKLNRAKSYIGKRIVIDYGEMLVEDVVILPVGLNSTHQDNIYLYHPNNDRTNALAFRGKFYRKGLNEKLNYHHCVNSRARYKIV